MKTNNNLFDKISKTRDGDIELERLIEMFEEIIDKGTNKETIDFFNDSIEEDFKEITKSKKIEEIARIIRKYWQIDNNLH